ncbi:MAG: hypothetical protein KME29_23240 [Calothrix sp. FI2-JRJ7]|nr:hypothetical protein [Calothrix sp. FI2-JRJ7]
MILKTRFLSDRRLFLIQSGAFGLKMTTFLSNAGGRVQTSERCPKGVV